MYIVHTVFCVPVRGICTFLFLRVCHIALSMPRAERLRNYATKQLNECANASGQRSLAVYFKGPANDQVDQDETGTSSSSTDNLQEQSAPNSIITGAASVIGDPWIKTANEFSESEKMRSENKGRYCQADWFKEHDWMQYHREKCAVFSERELTFTFAICYRPSVCLSVCRLSVVCRM